MFSKPCFIFTAMFTVYHFLIRGFQFSFLLFSKSKTPFAFPFFDAKLFARKKRIFKNRHSMKSSIYICAWQSHTNGKWQQKIVEGKKMYPVG